MASEIQAAGVILRRVGEAGERWLLLRATKHGDWGFPKGHAEAGESLAQAARRECAEECGIGLLQLEGPPLVLHYRLPDGRAKLAAYFPATTAQERVVLSTEHDRFGWLDPMEVLQRLPHAQLREMFTSHYSRHGG